MTKRMGLRKPAPKSASNSASRAGDVVFIGIGRAATCAGAAQKQGRRIVESDLSILENAALVSRSGKILWIGPQKDLPKEYKKSQKTDFRGASIIPGLIECHTHLVYAGDRAAEFERRLRGESYQKIAASGGGILSTVHATRKASESDLRGAAQKRVDRFLAQGVTTIEAKSGYGLDLENELKLLRVARKLKSARIVSTFLGAHALAPEFNTAASYLDYLSSKVLPAIKKLKLASRVDIFVENGYFSVDIARPYLKLAKQMGFDLTIHADQLTRSGGARLAMELGAKSADHLLCLDDKDISKIALSPVTCVALPTSDLYMRSAYPRTRELLDRGARVALATDLNPGTAPSQDLALTGLLARVRPEMQMSFAEVLVGYTVSAAYALGLESSLGSLEVGKSCDFSVLSGDLSGLFLEAGQMPIRQTFKEAGSVFGGNLSRKSKGSF